MVTKEGRVYQSKKCYNNKLNFTLKYVEYFFEDVINGERLVREVRARDGERLVWLKGHSTVVNAHCGVCGYLSGSYSAHRWE